MSNYRLSVFDTCKLDTASLRGQANVQDTAFTYDSKLTKSDACKVQQWLSANGVKSSHDLLSYDGMHKAMTLMCRWPRPSELFTMIGCIPTTMTPPVKRYYRICVDVSATDRKAFGRLVGVLGANFNELGEEYNLMYIWLHNVSAGKSQIVMYSQYEGNLTKVVKGLRRLANRSKVSIDGISKTGIKTFTLSARAKPFEPDV